MAVAIQILSMIFVSSVHSAEVAPHAEVMLRVRPHVVVAPESEVRLSQLVDAQGFSLAALQQMDAVVLSRAPAFGERQELAHAGVMSALRPIVEGERARNKTLAKIHLSIPKTVTIDTVKREISREMVEAELLQAWQPLCVDCRLSIEGISLPQVNNLRDWSLRLKPELPRGSFSIPVDVIRQDGSSLPAWVSGRLLVKRRVPVAQRLIGLGERLESKDVSWDYRDTSFSIDGIPGEDELVGKRAKQGLRTGEIIWRGYLEKEKAIHRGDLVTVRSGEGSWEVSMNVIAQQDAYIGDTVNLKHPKNNTVLVGQVTGLGEVNLR